MQALRRIGALLLLAAIAILACIRDDLAQSGGQLKAGNVAPAFSLSGSDGKTYSLADFKGKQAVVLAWFVKAYSGG